jgi:6-phosphogluconate dehydrogenase
MQIGMIGLGRMGSNMVRRLQKGGHECVVYDANPGVVNELESTGARGTASLAELVAALAPPRAVWLMLPAAIVDRELEALAALLARGDIVIDGGNSYYRDDLRRAAALADLGLHYLDVGTSGGILGAGRGYCLMIGGEEATVSHLAPIFETLAPGVAAAPRTRSKEQSALPVAPAEQGFLHCGPHGAGHFVKMVHNGIEYGLMAAYAEGLNILHHAGIGAKEHSADAETAPLRDAKAYAYDFNLAEITELWRRGSVISSWLLDLTATALADDPELAAYSGRVSDSGEGRWTVEAAIEEGVPAPVLSAALFARFDSQGQALFANQVLSAMRHAFGGHLEKPKGP